MHKYKAITPALVAKIKLCFFKGLGEQKKKNVLFIGQVNKNILLKKFKINFDFWEILKQKFYGAFENLNVTKFNLYQLRDFYNFFLKFSLVKNVLQSFKKQNQTMM